MIFEVDTTEGINAYKVKIEESKEFGHNDFVLIDKECAIMQSISHALKHWKGEDCIDINTGIDYKTFFHEYTSGNKNMARAMIVNAIMEIEGVKRIIDIDFKENAPCQELVVTYSVETDYGIVEKTL